MLIIAYSNHIEIRKSISSFIFSKNGKLALPSSSDVGDGIYSTQVLHEDDTSDAESWCDGNVEASITIQETWVTAI